jgi:hypothetical protein
MATGQRPPIGPPDAFTAFAALIAEWKAMGILPTASVFVVGPELDGRTIVGSTLPARSGRSASRGLRAPGRRRSLDRPRTGRHVVIRAAPPERSAGPSAVIPHAPRGHITAHIADRVLFFESTGPFDGEIVEAVIRAYRPLRRRRGLGSPAAGRGRLSSAGLPTARGMR